MIQVIRKIFFPGKAYLLVLSFILLSISIFAQQKKILYFDEKWKPTEKKYASYYREISYDANGNPVGVVRDHYMSGQIQWVGKLVLSHGKELNDSICTWYFEDGKKAEEKGFAKGIQEGPDSVFYEDGQLQQVSFYKNDKQDGFQRTYFPSGKLNEEEYWEDGKIVGQHKYWFEDGQLRSIENYKNGFLEGESVEFNYSGCVVEKRNYHLNRMVGYQYEFDTKTCDTLRISFFSGDSIKSEQIKFDNHHQLIYHSIYLKIIEAHIDTQFYSDGKIAQIGIHNKRVNYDSSWFHNGKVKRVTYGVNDGNSRQINYDSTGRIMDEIIPDSMRVHIGKENGNCLYGFKDYKENWVVPPRFAYIEKIPNGFFRVEENSKQGIYSSTGKEIIAPQYESIENVDYNYDTDTKKIDHTKYYGFFLARKSFHWILIDFNNKNRLPEGYAFNNEAGEGMICAEKDDIYFKKYFILDTNGIVYGKELWNPVSFNEYGYALLVTDSLSYQHYSIDNPSPRKFGVINKKGKIIVPDIYDNVYLGWNRNDYFWVCKNKKWGLCDTTGKVILKPLYTMHLMSPNYSSERNYFYKDSLAVVSLNGKSGVVDTHGRFILPLKYDSINIVSLSCIIYEENHSFGIWNLKSGKKAGKNISSCSIFEKTVDPEKGMCILACINGKYGIINSSDSILFPFVWDNAWINIESNTELYAIKDDTLHMYSTYNLVERKIGFYDVKFENGYAIFPGKQGWKSGGRDHLCGVINESGKIILPPFCHDIIINADGIVFADSLDQVGIIMHGKEPRFLSRNYVSEKWEGDGIFYVKTKSGKVGAMNLDGKLLIDTTYFVLGEHVSSETGAWVKIKERNDTGYFDLKNNWGYMDWNGKFISKPVFDHPARFFDSIAIVSAHGKFGLLNRNGKLILDTTYDKILRDVNGSYILEKNKLYGLASSKGILLDQPQWQFVSGFLTNAMLFYVDSTHVGMVDTLGKIILPATLDYRNYGFDFSSNIEFYLPDYEYRKFGNRHYYEKMNLDTLHDKIFGYDSLDKIKNFNAQLAAKNNVIALAAFSNTRLYDLTDFEIPNDDYYYDSYYYDENREKKLWAHDYHNWRDTTYSYNVTVLDATPFSYSLNDRFTKCWPSWIEWDENVYTYKDVFQNFSIRNDSIYPITLDSLFDAQKNYMVFLNNILANKISKMSDVNFDCSNPDKYAQRAGNNFSIGKTGITFYILKTDVIRGEYKMGDYLPVTISYQELTPIIAKKSILQKFSSKK